MNYIVLWKDVRLFVGRNKRSVTGHKHPVIQMVVATDGEFKTKVPETGEWIYKKGLLIKPNYPHQCDATDVPIISLEIGPHTSLGEWILTNILQENPILDYSSEKYGPINFDLINNLLHTESWNKLYAHIKEVFRFDDQIEPTRVDERINKVLNYIHANINQTLSTEQLVNIAFLSESRLLHLFKEQMGLPIRNYILWYRLKVAQEQVIAGASLTVAAHRAGFSDQSHFTRNFVNMTGVPPSTITKNSKFIQVSFSS